MPPSPSPQPAAAAAAPVSRGDRPLVAAAWMGGALVCFSTMAVAGREVSVHLDTFELMAYRSVIGALIVVAALSATGKLGDVRMRKMKLHLARNVAHFTGRTSGSTP